VAQQPRHPNVNHYRGKETLTLAPTSSINACAGCVATGEVFFPKALREQAIYADDRDAWRG